MEIRLVPAGIRAKRVTALLLVFAISAVAPSDAHAFGSAWKGIKWTGRQAKKILPPYGGGLKCDAEGNESFNGCYYDDINLNDLKVVRAESVVDFDWRDGSPDSKIQADTFSARFVGNFTFEAADYTFSVTADDGVRLYLDSQLLIDQWNDHGPTTFTSTRSVSAGKHKVHIVYYENLGSAALKLSWSNTGGGPTGPGPIPTDGPFGPNQIPYEEELVRQVNAANPGLMAANCKAFQAKVMEALRAKDYHWGYCNYGSFTPEDRFMYGPNGAMVDAIVSACGPSPSVGWRTEANDPACQWSSTNSHPGTGGPGNPTPPNQYAPPNGPPYEEQLVKQINAENPGLISNCIGRPIANDWMITVVNRLQQKDPRWGYMRKPDGRIPRDILAYAWGSETEGTHNTYIIDFVSNGCGNSPNNPDEFNAPQPNAGVWWNVLNKDTGFADNGVWTFRP